MSINTLRQQIAGIGAAVPGGVPRADGFATGIGRLDAILPASGIPRGRVTELVGVPGGGRTTLLRSLVQGVVGGGLWVAYVDVSRTLAPAEWSRVGGAEGFWVVRPPSGVGNRGAWCADVLLRSGAFGLVVLDGGPVLTRSVVARLGHLARDTNTAFVVTGEPGGHAVSGAALRLRVRPSAGCFTVVLERGGVPAEVEVSCVIGLAGRLRTDSEVPDRRGVGRRVRGKWGALG